jgi:hypothetical protein
MLKHIIAIILLTLLVILATPQVHAVVAALVAGHDWIAETLKSVFAGGTAGKILKELIASLAIPLIVGLIPAGIYWLVKRSWFPYYMTCVWVVWLIQTSALLIRYTMATS